MVDHGGDHQVHVHLEDDDEAKDDEDDEDDYPEHIVEGDANESQTSEDITDRDTRSHPEMSQMKKTPRC